MMSVTNRTGVRLPCSSPPAHLYIETHVMRVMLAYMYVYTTSADNDVDLSILRMMSMKSMMCGGQARLVSSGSGG